METIDNTAILPPSVAPAATEPAAPVEAPATEALPKKDIWGEAAERLKAALAEQQATPAAETPSGEPQPHWQGQPRDEQGKWTAAQQAAAQAAAAAVQPTEGAEPAAEPAEPAIQIALPAVRDGQEPVVVEADDQETADKIRALINSHKREADTKRRMQAVEARDMEGRELETMINYVIISGSATSAVH